MGNQPPYSRINARWDAPEDELDNDNSSARLFERSRIKALAGTAWGHRGLRGMFTIPRSVPLPMTVKPLYVSGEPWRGSDRDAFARLKEAGQPWEGAEALAVLPRTAPHFLPGASEEQ